MPRMDGTGPAGQGPMTGRGLGSCGTSGVNNNQNTDQQQGSWLIKLLQEAIGALGAYGTDRSSGRGNGGGRGRRGSSR